MANLLYLTLSEAEQRSAEFWTQVRGPGWQPGNVTQYLYVWQTDDVDGPVMVVNERSDKLDTLIVDNVMTALEAIPCALFYPAWSTGQAYSVGDILTYDGNLYVVRQAHTSQADWQPPNVLALYRVYRQNADTLLDWIESEAVEIGWQRTYSGGTYECIQAHVTQADWQPPNVPALWSVVVAPTAEWSYPVAYKIGDVVLYNGVEYRCIQAHTSQADWTPPVVPALWELAA